jgi:4-amino-4-deoxy-L-arabinose transferase-like glycosyltransferase
MKKVHPVKRIAFDEPEHNLHLAVSPVKKIFYSCILLLLVFGASFYSIKKNRQFELMGGMAEEYLALGVNMYYTGTFYLTDTIKTPFAFRPPGYVKYLDLVLTTYGGMLPKNYQFHSREEFDQQKAKVLNAVYISQCLLIALSSLILFFLLSGYSGIVTAFILSLIFGINPYLIILAGLVHYETLHIFMILLSTWLLQLAFVRKKSYLIYLFLAGVSWGVATLVRPVSLILPALFAVMLLLYFRRNWKKSLLYFSVFTITFIGTIAPYTYRNYKLLHRFIPVNAQSNIVFWASSKQSLPLDANHYRWWQIWYPDGEEIYNKITGTTGYQTTLYAAHVLEFEDLFHERFKENIASHPMTYIGNVCKNFLLLNFGMNAVFIKMFQYQQDHSGEINKQWLETGNKQDFYPDSAMDSFSFLILLLTIFSIAGIILALRQNDKLIYIPLLAFSTIVIAHSITYMDLMYYYVRIPFLFIFTAFFIRHLDTLFKNPVLVRIQRMILGFLAFFMLVLYLAVIA